MRKLMIASLMLLSAIGSFSQGIKFFHGNYDELLAEAKKQNKKIFIDFYTKWCGPCRAMANNVFPLDEVGNFYNKHFINYKVDAEIGEGPMLAKKYGVKGYPTFMFTDAEGNSIYEGSSIGASDKDSFIRLGKLALGLEKKTWDWYQSEYKKGVRNTEFLKGYIVARLAAQNMPPDEKLKWELFNSYPEEKRFNDENIQTVFWAAKPGNKFYKVLLENKEKFPQLDTAKLVVHWINTQLSFAKWDSTVKSDALKKVLKTDFPQYFDQAIKYYNIDSKRLQGQNAEYLDEIFTYADTYGEPLHMGFGVGFAALAVENLKPQYAKRILIYFEEGLDTDPPHFFSVSAYAYLLYAMGEKDKARDFALNYVSLTETFSDSKKSKWSYETMKALEKGEKPVYMKR